MNSIDLSGREEANPECVVQGDYSEWGPYSSCSDTCTRTRSRECNNPLPYNSRVGNHNSRQLKSHYKILIPPRNVRELTLRLRPALGAAVCPLVKAGH